MVNLRSRLVRRGLIRAFQVMLLGAAIRVAELVRP
jgi:hypothetical protein